MIYRVRYGLYALLEKIVIFSLLGKLLAKTEKGKAFQQKVYRYVMSKQKRIQFEQIYGMMQEEPEYSQIVPFLFF